MEILKVQVKKISKPLFWYRNYIGDIFNVTLSGNNEIVFDDNGFSNTVKRIKFYIVLDEQNEKTTKRISIEDCKIINISDKIERIKKRLNEQ
jgi:hypothetical protein